MSTLNGYFITFHFRSPYFIPNRTWSPNYSVLVAFAFGNAFSYFHQALFSSLLVHCLDLIPGGFWGHQQQGRNIWEGLEVSRWKSDPQLAWDRVKPEVRDLALLLHLSCDKVHSLVRWCVFCSCQVKYDLKFEFARQFHPLTCVNPP